MKVKGSIATLKESSMQGVRVQLARKIQAAFTSIVMTSPVDTGRFRDNWNLSYGTPDYSFRWNDFDATGQDALDRVRELDVTKISIGKVYFTNSLHYAQALAMGHSRQAANGWIRAALNRETYLKGWARG